MNVLYFFSITLFLLGLRLLKPTPPFYLGIDWLSGSLQALCCDTSNKEDPLKNDLLKLIQWFCRKLTYNDLASVVPVLQEVLSGSRRDVELKSAEDRPPHYRQFRVDPALPLTEPLVPVGSTISWQEIQRQHEQKKPSPFRPGCQTFLCGASASLVLVARVHLPPVRTSL